MTLRANCNTPTDVRYEFKDDADTKTRKMQNKNYNGNIFVSPNGGVLASVIFTGKYDQGTIRNHILMKVANPWAHALALLSPSGEVGGVEGSATSTHRALQPTVKSTRSSEAPCWRARCRAQRDWHPKEGEWASCQASSHSLVWRWQESSVHPYTHISLSHHQCRQERSMTGPNTNSPQRDHPVTTASLAPQ